MFQHTCVIRWKSDVTTNDAHGINQWVVLKEPAGLGKLRLSCKLFHSELVMRTELQFHHPNSYQFIDAALAAELDQMGRLRTLDFSRLNLDVPSGAPHFYPVVEYGMIAGGFYLVIDSNPSVAPS